VLLSAASTSVLLASITLRTSSRIDVRISSVILNFWILNLRSLSIEYNNHQVDCPFHLHFDPFEILLNGFMYFPNSL
jgi:hypothetical protein